MTDEQLRTFQEIARMVSESDNREEQYKAVLLNLQVAYQMGVENGKKAK